MYNEERKLRFIEEEKDGAVVAKGFWNRLFILTDKLESVYKKDICDFTANQITDFYKLINTRSLERLLTLNYSIGKYNQWCLQNGFVNDGMNHVYELTTDIISSCVNKEKLNDAIISREDLIESIEYIENYQDKFLLLGIFEGIKGKRYKEILNLKLEDFDFDNNTVKLFTGRIVNISEELAYLARKSAQQDTYINNGRGNEMKLFGDTIIKITAKGSTEEEAAAKRTKTVIERLTSYIDRKEITSTSLYSSGMIYNANILAKKYGVTAKEIILQPQYYEYLKSSYEMSYSTRVKFAIKYDDYLVK